ncbi:lamin tail domain-containing protein [Candidatus Woesearchaeota archaeon]|nr:lamin tail domain-containing protein [Candidatus Woesearchaeota archaeon]
MKKILLLLLFVPFAEGVIINEIMYNPSGNEFDFEYLELYGQGNLSGWMFEGIDLVFPENSSIDGHMVIANTLFDEGGGDFFDRYGFNASFEYKGSLHNDGETIILRDGKNKIVDIVTYDDLVEENHSLERIDIEKESYDLSNWAESVNGGTPGKENSVSMQNGCDWELALLMNSSIAADFKLQARRIKGKGKTNLSIALWIEDTFGNIIKKYMDIKAEAVTKKTSSSYRPSLGSGFGYIINANLTLDCEDSTDNNALSELIFIPEERVEGSSLEILGVSKAEYGKEIKVRLKVYKGNTSKYAVHIYAENGERISETSSLHFRDKYQSYSLTVPLLLEKCGEEDASVVVEGLGMETRKDISIEKKECEKTASQKFSFDIYEMPMRVRVDEPFEIKVYMDNYEGKIGVESYVYKGKTRYSEAKKTVFLNGGRIILLEHVVSEGKEGDYSVKVRVMREGYKTASEKIQKIFLEVPVVEEKVKIIERKIDVPLRECNEVIYESENSKELVPLFLLGLFVLAAFLSVLRK